MAVAVLLRSGCPATVAGLRCGTGRGVRKGAAVCGLGAASAGGESKQELEEVASREAAGQDLEGEASSEEIEVRVLVLFLCCCIAAGIVAWGVCVYIPGVDL